MTLASFVPADRRATLTDSVPLPTSENGSALFADIGGFTSLAETLERVLGPQRGAERLSSIVNRIFDALVLAVHKYHGSIIAFSGDAITCWFKADDGRLGAKCALEMQSAMSSAGQVSIPGVHLTSVGLKVTVAAGTTRRFQVGDPTIQLLDCIAGGLVDRLATGEHLCRVGDVLVDDGIAQRLGTLLCIDDWREQGSVRFARIMGLAAEIPEQPWTIAQDDRIAAHLLSAWILPPVYERLQSGQSRFLAEFRPIAALFARFSGLEYDVNPQAHEYLDRFVRWAMAVVTRHGGFMFQVNTGDKGSHFLAVFGAPVAHGDDVRRAVAAAHELRQPSETLLGIRDVQIGVNAGRVYAGLYSGLQSVYTVFGDSVNLAARLMEAAHPGQVLVSAHVAAALDRRFTVCALDPIKVKGRSTLAPICELLGRAAVSVRLSEPRYPLPIVGRTDEIGAIAESVRVVQGGRGRVLGFCGDAGMGKSRLVNQTIQRATAASFACFAGECGPYSTATAYLPWQEVWRGLFGLLADDPPDRGKQRLEAALGESAVLAPLFDRLLDLPMADNDATRSMPAPVRKQTLEQLLAGWLRSRASAGPICVVLEDCHWIDALSQDLLSAIAGAIGDLPVLIVLAYRPIEVEEPLHFRIDRILNLSEIRLGELSFPEALKLVTMLTAQSSDTNGPASEGLARLLAERSEGNPYYIEELVRYVSQSRLDFLSEAALEQLELPTSLESLILTRIDRLSERQQRAVKVSSVIGRRFSVAWLLGAYVNTIDEAHTPRDLERICEAGFTVIDTPPPQLAYLFRHSIVREVAYGTLSYSLRQELHERLALYLEGLSGDRRPVDLLAYHYARSANRIKEAEYRQLAAELAIRNGAYGDALQHVRRASEIVAAQSEGSTRLGQELELQLLLGTILLVVQGQGSIEAKGAYDRARELARSVTPGSALGRAIFGLWTYYLFQGLMQPASDLAEEAVALTSCSPDPGVRIMAQLAACQTHMWTGQWCKCAEHFDQVLELYDPSLHDAYLTQYAQNPRFTASGSGFWALWILGHRDKAAAVVNAAILEAAGINHDFTFVIAYLNRPLLAYLERRQDLLATSTGKLLECALRARNPFYIAMALVLDAWSKVMSGRYDEGLAQLVEQDATMRALGSNLVEPLITSMLAEGYLHAKRLDEGLTILDERFGLFAEQGRLSLVPEHLRVRAELLLARGDGHEEEAVDHLRRAIAVARQQKALSFELRAATSLARILRNHGNQASLDEAAALVNPVYRAFSEGLESLDLREAAAFVEPTPRRFCT
jgi:class 3 adenylate cyclase/predicted ATPase